MKDAQSASNGKAGEKRKKVYVNGVDVSELLRREIYFDENGKPITSSLKDFTKQKIKLLIQTLNNSCSAGTAPTEKKR